MRSTHRRRLVGTIGTALGVIIALLGAGVAVADPSGVPTNSNKGSLYGMPQPGGAVAGKNGDMFRVTWTDDAGATTSTLSYCVEASVPIAILEPYRTATWSDASRNAFVSQAPKVQWILQNAYPTFTGAQLAARTGIAGITDQDAITATQFAIWNLTDPTLAGGLLFPSPTTVPQDLATYPRSTVIQQLMVWLLDNAQATGTEPLGSLTISPTVATAPAATLAGPFTVSTTSPTGATITVDQGAVVDATGAPVTGPILNGGTFWIDARTLPAGADVAIGATAQNASILPGTIITSATPDVRTQNIIVATTATFTTARASAALSLTQQATGALAIHKQDATDAAVPLAGAVFDVIDASGAVIGTLTTDESGNASIAEIPLGDYTLVETAAPAGYLLDGTPHPATATSDVPVPLTITNQATGGGAGGGGGGGGEAETGGLAASGTDIAPPLAVGLLLIVAGALVRWMRPRRLG